MKRNKHFSFSTGNILFDFENFQYYDFPNITIDADIFMVHGNGNSWEIEFRECNPINISMCNGKFDIGDIHTELDTLTFKELRVIAKELPGQAKFVRIGKKQTLVTDLARLLFGMLSKLVKIEKDMRLREKWNYTNSVGHAIGRFIYTGM